MDTWNGIPIIDDQTPDSFVFDPSYARGAEPRDYAVQPTEMMAAPSEFNLPKPEEWDEYDRVLVREEATLHHVVLRAREKGRFKDCYQNGHPFCWSHSTAHGIMVAREVANQPPVKISAYMLACLSDGRGYQNKGGWSALSAMTAETIGACPEPMWQEGKTSRSLDTPAMRAEAAKYKITEPMVDLTRDVYFRNLPFEMVIGCLLTGRPVMVDFNWWGHAVLGVRAVKIEDGSWGIMILNSHGLNWGDRGFGILRGSRARPDGAVAVNTVQKTVSAVAAPKAKLAA